MKKITLKPPDPNSPYMKAYAAAVANGLKALHVTPLKDRWVVKKIQSSEMFQIFVKKADAVKYGTRIAKNERTELIIHGKDGRIRERNSY